MTEDSRDVEPGDGHAAAEVGSPTPAQGRWWPYIRAVLFLGAALTGAAIVSALAIDLGPALRGRVEAAGTAALERPLHIGRLSIRLLRGTFVLEDVVIEGLTPEGPPFFVAQRIEVAVRWPNVLRREIWLETLTLRNWRMAIEVFPGGQHNLPRLRRGPDRGAGRVVTTFAFVQATGGELTYRDHGAPWRAVARNLELTVTRTDRYRGLATFTGGTVEIGRFRPMPTDLRTTFTIEAGRLLLDRVTLTTGEAVSDLTGVVDLARWPEQRYEVQSRVPLPWLRDTFFAGEPFRLAGEAEFTGTFRIFRGGRLLEGTFASPAAGVNPYRFEQLRGRLRWDPDRFDATDVRARCYGGTVLLRYELAPLGRPSPPEARFDGAYEKVDLALLAAALGTVGIRPVGALSGRLTLAWPLGRFREARGDGVLTVEPPAGVRLLEPVPTEELRRLAAAYAPVPGPFNPDPAVEPIALGGSVQYAFDPDGIDVAPSHLATRTTYVRFRGRSAYGERSSLAFRVLSADWQESDRLLAGALTAFGVPTRAVAVGGWGSFEGMLFGSIRRPRIEGVFVGGDVRVWDVTWGRTEGRVVVENDYVEVLDGVVSRGDGADLDLAGRFSLSVPRADRGEEFEARVRARRWPVRDFMNAFDIERYPVEGRLSGEFHLYGRYRGPFGFGRLTIDNGSAYGEPFETATAAVRFEGEGVRLDGVELRKGGGLLTGAAYIGWDGSYSFHADGRRIPLESVRSIQVPRAPLSGLAMLTASGAGTFAVPQYEVRVRVADLYLGDEGIGVLTGRLGVRGEVLSFELEAASSRLVLSGSGQIALTPEADAELTFRFNDTSLDPYVRLFEPRLSPYASAVASGTLRVVGELANVDRLIAEGTVERLELKLLDYEVHNDGPVHLALDRHTVRLHRLRLVGRGTALALSGSIDLHNDRLALEARGDADLGFLQVFFRDLRASGAAELVAEVRGSLAAPVVSGFMAIAGGRLRHFALPHSLDGINGRVEFDAGGLRLDQVSAVVGGGQVQFGGRIGLRGYRLGELDVTAVGRGMHLRYPEGFRSVVDAELNLRGDVTQPLLAGRVTVRDAVWLTRFDAGADWLEWSGERAATSAGAPAPTLPLAFDVRIVAPSTLRIDNPGARIVASADLSLRGTYDRPLLFGRADIERGEVFFEGNRYLVTRGVIEFANPARIEPFFDVEAETRVRVPGETYRIIFRATGTAARIVPELSSDPPLAPLEILALLFGDLRDPRAAELLIWRRPEEAEQKLLQARAARLLASPLSAEVGRVVQQTLPVDTFQITPSLGDLSAQQAARINPTARLTVGKRLSERVYLVFSRALSAEARDQIVLLEYTHSDRFSWVVSQNEDRTYAIDFRVRHVF